MLSIYNKNKSPLPTSPSRPATVFRTTLNSAYHKRACFTRTRQLGRVVRDGAAIRDRICISRRENHPVRLLLPVRPRGQFRALAGGHPRVTAVAENGVLPGCRAGAVGEVDVFVVVEDVRVGAGAWEGGTKYVSFVVHFVSLLSMV